ncbi:hypothetical protein [Geminocystis sp. NIES-3709]|uniref:hypothetical protein n=1 Tax=Geminocystis sp. NIES-3709 TaxID=1617448 RepID=UPI0005FC96CC|nr:hypothetical protein [Geminocystis sp. NIES-3709]BAQ63772.1 hypothetical protein GM3709_537 [Geminocystis sp. NIES-3709]
MNGSTLYLLEQTVYFEKSFQKLVKTYKSQDEKIRFSQNISNYLDALIINPYPPQARTEPLPSGLKLSQEWRFYKLVIVIAKGASGQIRIMYLLNEKDKIIKPLWIYSHQQFTKRPPDKEIKQVIQEVFEE